MHAQDVEHGQKKWCAKGFLHEGTHLLDANEYEVVDTYLFEKLDD